MIGPWQIIVVALLLVVLFGRGKISAVMGDIGKGVSSFKAGLKGDQTAHVESAKETDQSASVSGS